jgi:hypothetical protein
MLLAYTTRPAVVVVGFGRLSVWPAVVWLIVKFVFTSTVAAAVPITPPVAKFDSALAVFSVAPAFVTSVPFKLVIPDTAKLLLSVVAPVTPKVPPTVALLVTDNVLSVVAPVTPNVPPTVALLVTPRLLRVVAPVTFNVPPIVALLLTLRPVPVAASVTAPLKVLAPPNV